NDATPAGPGAGGGGRGRKRPLTRRPFARRRGDYCPAVGFLDRTVRSVHRGGKGMRLDSIAFGLASGLAVLASAVAQDGPVHDGAQERPARTLTFGVYSFKKPTEVVRDFAVATDALAAALTKDTGAAVAIQLRVFKTYDECLTRFVAGDIDIVRFGPASYVLAQQRQPKVQLLAAEQEDGKKRCKGVIVVRKESPIRSLADLKGHSFAFGDENSTIGRYLSQEQLVDAGIHADDLSSFRYL